MFVMDSVSSKKTLDHSSKLLRLRKLNAYITAGRKQAQFQSE